MRKEVKINEDVHQVAIYSNSTAATNLAAGGYDEPGILALAEVEVFGKTQNSCIYVVKYLY